MSVQNNMAVINNKAILLAEQYNTSIKNVINVSKLFEKNINNINNTTNHFNIQLVNASNITNNFNNALSKTASKVSIFDKMKDKLKELISVQTIVKKGFELMGKGLNTATELQKSEQLIGAVLGDTKVGSRLFNHISKQAKGSSLSIDEMAANTQKFLGVTRSVEDIDQLNSMSEKLAKLNISGQDAKGAGDALKKAMQGDYSDLTKSFNIDAGAIKGSGLENAVSMGNMAEAVDILDDLISKSGYSQEALDNMVGNLSIQWGMFTKKISEDFGGAMRIVADTLAPIVTKFNELLKSGAFQPFIDILVGGFNLIAIGLSWLVNGFIWLGEVIGSNWDIIQAVLGGVAAALMVIGVTYIPMLIGKLWMMIQPLLVQAATWIMMNLPIFMFIAAVAIVIYILGQMGVTFEQIFEVVGGILGVFVGYFYNSFIYLWNIVAAFINFFGNVFSNPVAAVQKLFYDLAVNVLSFIEKIAQGIEDLLNGIPGVKVSLTSGITNLKNNLAAKAGKIADENQLKEFVKSKEFVDYSDAFTQGASTAGDFYKGIKTGLGSILPNSLSIQDGNLTLPGLNNKDNLSAGNPFNMTNNESIPVSGPNGGNVPVDVSDDDVQYLKDIAERDYINKYSSATLAPNIQVSFGDVKETADVDKVAQRIQYILQEQIAIAAEGAY
ncbi:hypothetical protein [Cellulosilyticum sp. I15G10I2]|uniref:hypothetical protein n=1 Tax=Cellulosilyticum sp. I15G10I2 TaxID=1892843 RepID=UPI00085CB7E0|nr:hypothetical protein [Cellulosilyticum sp. I15G10I2]